VAELLRRTCGEGDCGQQAHDAWSQESPRQSQVLHHGRHQHGGQCGTGRHAALPDGEQQAAMLQRRALAQKYELAGVMPP
jgi:hypothetical protein